MDCENDDNDLSPSFTFSNYSPPSHALARSAQLGGILSETTINSTAASENSVDLLERYGRWLVSIPRDDALALQQTPEYHQFRIVFEQLGHAHRTIISQNRTIQNETRPKNYSFLQHLAVDDVVLRVFEFMECSVLLQTSLTCHRLRNLAKKSAIQRTQGLTQACTLHSSMKMLRAQEQIDGVNPSQPPFVRVPILGLHRRICVNQCGDEDYNGIYFCTQVNGNGYVFTKPRHPPSLSNHQRPVSRQTRQRSKKSKKARPLQCIFAKRFSNETILWYLSKELDPIEYNFHRQAQRDNIQAAHQPLLNEEDHNHQPLVEGDNDNFIFMDERQQQPQQKFSFWANLIMTGETTPDRAKYPSQTSILSRNGNPAWQALETTRGIQPPIVELLD